MGFFDDQEAREKIKILETKLSSIDATLQKLKETQNDLDLQIKEASKRTPDFEQEARQASESAKINSETTQQALIEVNAIKEKLKEFLLNNFGTVSRIISLELMLLSMRRSINFRNG